MNAIWTRDVALLTRGSQHCLTGRIEEIPAELVKSELLYKQKGGNVGGGCGYMLVVYGEVQSPADAMSRSGRGRAWETLAESTDRQREGGQISSHHDPAPISHLSTITMQHAICHMTYTHAYMSPV